MRLLLLAFLVFFLPNFIFAQNGDKTIPEKDIVDRDDIVFYGGFEDYFNNSTWRTRWGVPWNNRASEAQILSGSFDNSKYLKVGYPIGGVGPQETGIQFPIILNNINSVENNGYFLELYFRYYVYFEEGFDFNEGGKLPGLMGGVDSYSRSGGNQPDGSNGWTLRFMFRKDGELVVYAYLPVSNNGKWGGVTWGQDISTGINAVPGKWHCIEQYVNVGSAGNDDGQLKVWIDDELRIEIDDMRFWDVENDYGKIGGIYFSTFHGGSGDEWAPRTESNARFDGLVLGKSRIGPYNLQTSDAFYTDNHGKIICKIIDHHRLFLEYPTDNAGPVTLEVFDINGQLVYRNKWMESAKGRQQRIVQLDHLKKGMHIINFNVNGNRNLLKLYI